MTSPTTSSPTTSTTTTSSPTTSTTATSSPSTTVEKIQAVSSTSTTTALPTTTKTTKGPVWVPYVFVYQAKPSKTSCPNFPLHILLLKFLLHIMIQSGLFLETWSKNPLPV